MEEISAKSLDEQENINTKKGGPVEHLREMRDVFTTFVKKFTEQFADFEAFAELSEVCSPEVLTEKGYLEILTVFSQPIWFDKGISLTRIMFTCMEGHDMYDLMYKQVLACGKTPESKEKEYELLKAHYVKFLEQLEDMEKQNSFCLKESLFKMSRDKRTLLVDGIDWASTAVQSLSNVLEEDPSAQQQAESQPHLGNYVSAKRAEKIVYGFSLGPYTEHEPPEKVFPPMIVLPVSEYGQKFTLKLYLVMQNMYSKVKVLKEEAKKMVESHQAMFNDTARGRDFIFEPTIEKYLGGILALEEGIATLTQVLALFTAQKIEGFGTGEELLNAIFEQDLPNKAGYLLAPAIIGPLSLSGLFIKDMVGVADGGRLVINRGLLEYSSKMKDYIFENQIPEQQGLPAAGRGCPVSFKGKDIEVSGINMLSQTFMKVFEQIK